MPSDSSAGCLSLGFPEHSRINPKVDPMTDNHFSQVDPMTALSLFTETVFTQSVSTVASTGPRLLAPARPRTTPMPPASSAGCLSHGFLEHRTQTRINHFSQVNPMTVLYTERLHRRVNWPPGCWRPPDRGRPLCRRPHPPDAFRMGSWNTGPEPETITFHKLIL